MKSVYSSSDNSVYDFFIPIAAYSWKRLSVDSIVFVPEAKSSRLQYCINTSKSLYPEIKFYDVKCLKHKESTFLQCARLYAAALGLPEDEVLVVSDVDMLNFRLPPLLPSGENAFSIWGYDLVPPNQFPMCYISGTVKSWRNVFDIHNKTYQEALDQLVGVIECEHFRGCQWSLDQDTAYKHISSNATYNAVPRARQGTQFAEHRIDRDDINWRSYLGYNLIDAHLWRPGYEENNFKNILELLQTQYPNDNFDWLKQYREQYISLL